jgi:nucleoside-diphosphate-sugar epimerase
MRFLLIGGNGFIGTHLTRQLLDRGDSIAILHRGKPSREATHVLHIAGDRNQLADARAQIESFAPDVIVDFILSSGQQARELMQVATGLSRRVIAVSTGDVYRAWGVLHGVESGPLEPLPITEDSALRTTRRLYSPETLTKMKAIFNWATEDYDKIAVEEAVMSSPDVPGTILRLPMVYGPGDVAHRFFPVLKRIADHRSAIILPEDFAAWRGPRGYVKNVAYALAILAADDRTAGRIYNVCDEPCLSELEWQKCIAKQTGWTGDFVVLPVADTPQHLRFPVNAAQHVVVSSDRIRSELAYKEIVPQDEAIRRTIAWEQQNPPSSFDPRQFDYAAEDAAIASAA